MSKLINEVLTIIRKEKKLTRKGMEQLAGFKERTIGSYERGENTPSIEYIEFICLFFGYTNEYVMGVSHTKLDKFVQTILIYQSIYNYDNKKMAKLMKLSLKDYENEINLNIKDTSRNYNSFNKTKYDEVELFEIAENLGIKPSCIQGKLDKYKKEIVKKLEIEAFRKLKNENEDNKDINIETLHRSLIYSEEFKDKKNEAIKHLLERETIAEQKGLNITPEYYASIIKKRNQPKENYTPNTQKENIPEKYKEVLELLPFAPDSFIDTIIQKLKTMKESQSL